MKSKITYLPPGQRKANTFFTTSCSCLAPSLTIYWMTNVHQLESWAQGWEWPFMSLRILLVAQWERQTNHCDAVWLALQLWAYVVLRGVEKARRWENGWYFWMYWVTNTVLHEFLLNHHRTAGKTMSFPPILREVKQFPLSYTARIKNSF